MVRPFKMRYVCHKPDVCEFGPIFIERKRGIEEIKMCLDELEAIRLADLLGYSHEASAERMGISRPTFGRILRRARYKSASALINGFRIVIIGGEHIMAQRTFKCADCGHTFSVDYGVPRPDKCPQCGSSNITRIDADKGFGARGGGGGRGPCGKGIGRFRGNNPK